ncbi:MAG: hypothetical protein RL375_822 [Pseudomonadota bacterium]|jgi:inner membrane protein
MRFPLAGKLIALLLVIVALLVALSAVEGVVTDRLRHQTQAQLSVAGSLAGAQALLGPALQRTCQETWIRQEGAGKDSKSVADKRDFVQTLWPRKLAVTSNISIEPRYRGLFKVNGYLGLSTLSADWAAIPPPEVTAGLAQARIQCEPAVIAVALSDARGLRSSDLRANGEPLAVLPGSGIASLARGLHAVLPDPLDPGAPLHVELTLALAGTGSLAWTPVGDHTSIQASSDWAHPSFAGQFLPVSREVTPHGFTASWQVSALATTARQALRDGGTFCALSDADEVIHPAQKLACVDNLGVSFIDPVNRYVLSDRAIKYGLLFIVLTFVGVGLVEVTRRLRVHPVQYLLVGCALTVFFLLLIALGEHVSFALAYVCAATACTALLTFYASHVLGGVRAGTAFGGAIVVLYGALYALLQLEQTALVLGAILLFVAIAAVMAATRRVDWYALAAELRQPAPLPPKQQPSAAQATPV